MKISFSDHARYQIRVRKLSSARVKVALKKPDGMRVQPDGRIMAVKKELRAGKLYLLVVVYEVERNAVTVVTVFRTSKVKKYL